MNNETSTIDQVRGLVASIPKHTGMYASVAEGFEPGGAVLISVYLEEPKGPRVLYASTQPVDDDLTLDKLREEVGEFITTHRKQEAA
jgi:hypothetical protein